MPGDSSGGSGEYEEDMEWHSAMNRRRKRLEKKARDEDWSDRSSHDEASAKRSKSVRSDAAQREKGKEKEKEEWKAVLVFGSETGHFHPVRMTKAIEKEFGKIKFAKFLNNRRVLIFATSKQQQDQILKTKELDGVKVTSHIPGVVAKMRGVISNVPLEMSEEEVKEELKGGKAVDIKRLKTNKDGVKKDSLSMLVQFEGILPKEIKMGWIVYRVREYITNPIRCYKCQRMGHVAQQCRGKLRCAKCGGEHEYGKCAEDAKLKCCNCGGEHSAAFGGCTVQIKAKEVQKYKITNNVSYAEALKKVDVEMERATVEKVGGEEGRRRSGELRPLPQRVNRPSRPIGL